jgi:filamentous hemagglutinin family protein
MSPKRRESSNNRTDPDKNTLALVMENSASSASWWSWQKRHFGIAITALGNAFALGMIATSRNYAIAQSQIVPDGTLGAERSQIIPNFNGLPVEVIQGGAIRGANLFHSFGEFNVAAGRGVYFFSPSAAIETILARVTGSNPSQILGTLGTFGNSNPNLFLINPNGIIFGSNSSLDVGGSFVATTANGVRLGNTGLFSASEPTSSNLLSIKPSAFFFNALSNQPIVNRSRASTTVVGDPTIGLQVPDGKSLLLLGGDVQLEGGGLVTQGGRIELGGVAGIGTVGLNINDNNLHLSFPDGIARADVSFTNNALVDTRGEGGGDIQVQGGRVNLTGRSAIFAFNSGSQNGQGIYIGAEQLNIEGGSQVSAGTFSSGKGGDVTIATRRLTIQQGGTVAAFTYASGDGGNLTVTASESVELIGRSADGQFPSVLFSETRGAGASGDLMITTGKLILRDGAFISNRTYDKGQAGNLSVTAFESVELSGTATLPNGRPFPSALAAQTFGAGDAGNLTVRTRQFLVQNGAQVSASTFDKGRGGTLAVSASDSVIVMGTSVDGQLPTALFSETQGKGDAGELTIETGRLLVRGGAGVSTRILSAGGGGNLTVRASNSVELIDTSVEGKFSSGLSTAAESIGDAGNLSIFTGQLLIQNGAFASAATSGEGKGGTLSVIASDSVNLIGTSTDGVPSQLLTETFSTADAGNLNIVTGRLVVRDGAQVSASTVGRGKGGVLDVNASDSVELIGTSTTGRDRSGLFVQTQGAGDAGNLNIVTRRLSARGGAEVSASTFSEGKGGKLTVTALDLVELRGTSADGQLPSGLFAQTDGSGVAGDLKIDTGLLIVRDRAQVTVSSQGLGNAGNLDITARSIELDKEGKVIAATLSGNGGNITLQVQDLLLLRNGSQISTSAGTAQKGGDGGNISINTPFIVAVPPENSAISANAFTGRGGNIQVTAQAIFGTQFRPQDTSLSDITASSQFGIQGTVQINTPDVDPSRGLANLPTEVVDASNQIDQTCPAGGKIAQNEFIITGRGGLPDNPSQTLSNDAVWTDLRPIPQTAATRLSSQAAKLPTHSKAVSLVEAQGWVINHQGQVVLTASAPSVTPESSRLTSVACPHSQH